MQLMEMSRVFAETMQGKSLNPTLQGRRDGCTLMSGGWRLLRWGRLETCDFNEEGDSKYLQTYCYRIDVGPW